MPGIKQALKIRLLNEYMNKWTGKLQFVNISPKKKCPAQKKQKKTKNKNKKKAMPGTTKRIAENVVRKVDLLQFAYSEHYTFLKIEV